MKTFVFFSLPAHGHTNPTLPVIQELVSRGNKVIYYSLPEFKAKIEQIGAIYRKYPEESQIEKMDARLSRNPARFARTLVVITDRIAELLIKEIKKDTPDCIVYDSFALWGKTTAIALGVPAATLYTTMTFNEKVMRKYVSSYFRILFQGLFTKGELLKGYALYRKIAKRYGFKPKSLNESMFNTEALNIVFTSQYFQPVSESFDDTFCFVGPSIQRRPETADFLKDIPKKKKVIYISIGTIFNDNLQFFKDCINVFGDTDYYVILSLGNRFTLSDLPPIPTNFYVKNSLPQLEVLQRADVFISHGGMNSVNESLFYGVPMVLVPQMSEQVINASRVQELGAGILLTKHTVTKERLLHYSEKVLHNASYADNAKKIQKTLHEAGGYKKAAVLLLQLVSA